MLNAVTTSDMYIYVCMCVCVCVCVCMYVYTYICMAVVEVVDRGRVGPGRKKYSEGYLLVQKYKY